MSLMTIPRAVALVIWELDGEGSLGLEYLPNLLGEAGMRLTQQRA